MSKELSKWGKNSGSVQRYGYGRIEEGNPWLTTAVYGGVGTGLAIVATIISSLVSFGFLVALFSTAIVLGVLTTAGASGMLAKQLYIDKKR